MNVIHIIYSSDDNYAQHVCVSICSLCENNKKADRLHFYLIDAGISIENKKKIIDCLSNYKNSKIDFVQPENRNYNSLPKRPHISNATYMRISIPSLVPMELEKILYLDSDTIVNGDITNLWDSDIENYHVAAVENADYPIPTNGIGFTNPSDYFNAGVMLINLRKWREDNITKKCFEFIEKNREKIIYEDQDTLNYIINKRWLSVQPIFNQQTALLASKQKKTGFTENEFIQAIKNPIIIHFSDNMKPWHYLCIHPFKETYFHYLHLTPWSSYRFPDKNLPNIIKKRVFIFLLLLKPVIRILFPEKVIISIRNKFFKI